MITVTCGDGSISNLGLVVERCKDDWGAVVGAYKGIGDSPEQIPRPRYQVRCFPVRCCWHLRAHNIHDFRMLDRPGNGCRGFRAGTAGCTGNGCRTDKRSEIGISVIFCVVACDFGVTVVDHLDSTSTVVLDVLRNVICRATGLRSGARPR